MFDHLILVVTALVVAYILIIAALLRFFKNVKADNAWQDHQDTLPVHVINTNKN